MREYKKRFAPFEKIQVDLKELKDIIKYYPYLHDNYPKYQFSARDMRTGVTFVSYGYEKSTINVGLFVLYLCQHLASMGVDLSKVEWQSDNGAEFVGPTNRKRGQTFYEDIVDQFGCKRSRIPPRQCTYNSDVEAIKGGEPEQLTTHHSDDFMPDWSPNGEEIAFHSFRDGSRDVFVMSSDGTSLQQLTFGPLSQSGPNWAPDGKQIVHAKI